MPFDFSAVAAPFRMQPGLRRIAPGAAPLTPAGAASRHLGEKIRVLGNSASQALLAVPDFDAAPILAALAVEASKSAAPAFTLESASRVAAPRLGWAVRDGAVQGTGDPAIGALLMSLRSARRATALLCLAFEEDFAVIDGADATIPWLAVCLPSRWAPEDKVGRDFVALHLPVADNEALISAADGLVRIVTGGDRWERLVWTICADGTLDQHPKRHPPIWPTAPDAEALGARAFFRHERQTFIPVPGARQAIFTIRVDSEPLTQALASREAAARLHAALSSMTPAVLAYRGLDRVRDPLLAWLERHATTLPAAS